MVPAGIGQFAIIQAAATSAGVDLKPVNLSHAGEIERAITAFARVPNGGSGRGIVSRQTSRLEGVGCEDSLMSALGQKQTCALHQPMSALPPKLDICVVMLPQETQHRGCAYAVSRKVQPRECQIRSNKPRWPRPAQVHRPLGQSEQWRRILPTARPQGLAST